VVPRSGETTRDVVRLFVATGPSGRPVFEEVPARQHRRGRWELLATPGLATGAAAGDVVAVRDDGSFQVVTRSGNLGMHVTAPAGADQQVDRLTSQLRTLGGWLDGRSWTRDRAHSLSVYTVPVKAGFPAIEAALRGFAAEVAGSEWYYLNVYDPADETTPLNWWK
jgi:hypothetical protein